MRERRLGNTPSKLLGAKFPLRVGNHSFMPDKIRLAEQPLKPTVGDGQMNTGSPKYGFQL